MKQTLKKFIYMLLVLSLILACIPAAAGAFPVSLGKFGLRQTETVIIPDPWDPDQRIRTVETTTEPLTWVPFAEGEYLTDPEAAGAILRETMENREATVTVLYEADADLEFEEVVAPIREAAMAHTGQPTEGDYLAKQRGTINASGSWSSDGTTNYYSITFTIEYYTTAEQETEMDTAVAALLDELALDGLSDYEKLSAVYEWMCANITYDYDNLEDDTYKLKYTAYAALMDRTAVCQGYAVLLYRLMLELGIDCRVVTGIGNGGGHAWNIVEMDGLYYNADATWDATWYQAGLEYNYFLRTNDTFGDHTRDEEFATEEFNTAYPMGETDYTPPVITEIASGTCGENLTWVLTDDGKLTISGTGSMKNYSFSQSSRAPWFSKASYIKSIVIGEGVTSVGKEAFDDCKYVTSVTIPSTVTNVGENAFSDCSSLTGVYISDLAAWCMIDFYAGGSINNPLYKAGNLYLNGKLVTELVIPDTLSSIGASAFKGCTSLTSVTIPDSVTSIGEGVFNRCANLASVAIPDTVTSIGGSAFMGCTSLTSVTIPNGVTSIGGYAFNSCSSLTNVTIPNSVTSIGWEAFAGCTSLVFNEYDNAKYLGNEENPFAALIEASSKSITSCTIHADVRVIADFAFNYRKYLTSIVIPDGVAGIGEYTFRDCSSLTSVTIPDSVTSIGDSAFNGCTSLTSVAIPDSVTSIGVYVFYGCTSLTNVTIGNSVTSIGEYAFNGCSSLSSVTIGDSVTSIGIYAFAGCTSLTDVTLPNSMTSIGVAVFRSCTSLTSVTIPNGVTSIGDSAFSGCTSLTDVTIPDSVTSIGNAAFLGCTSLRSVAIGDNVTCINASTFYSCTSLTCVSIPGNVTSIDWCAFSECTDLTVVMLPATLTYLDSGAFYGCTNLWHILYQGTETQWEAISGAFSDMTDLICHYNCTGEEMVDAENKICEICGNQGAPECSHTWDEGVVTLEPGCETTGVKTFTCTKCGETYTEEVSATGHISTHTENGKAANCYQDGYTGDSVCDACGVIVEYGSVIPATGQHEYTSQVTKEPTCETAGERRHICSICGDSYVTSIDATGHNYYQDTVVNPTCTEPGYISYVCTTCGNSYSVELSAKNHMYCWIVNYVDATCVTDGYSGDTVCADCGTLVSTGEVIPAYGHSFNGWEIVTEPTESECGYEMRTCWACGTTESRMIEPTEGFKDTMVFRNDGVAYLYDANGQLIQTYTGWMTEIYEIENDYDICAGGYMTTAPWFFDTFQVSRAIIEEGVSPASTAHWFDCWENLTSITIPDSITSIGDFMFHGCFSLTEITLPDTLTEIGDYAFDCYELTSIDLPDSLLTIGDWAFSGCSNLTSIDLPDALLSIGEHAFSGLYDLTSITIPASVTSIGSGAFSSCAHLSGIWVDENNAAYCNDSYGNLYSKDKTLLHTVRSNYAGHLTVADSVVTIGDYAFYGCNNLTGVDLPDGLRTIGDWAFYGCAGLTSITIPKTVTSIGSYAFGAYNGGLTEIWFKGDAPTFGENPFGYSYYGTLAAYYPAGNDTWTEVITQDYGREVIWVSYGPCQLGHTFDMVIVTPPTCREQGYTTYICTVCGEESVWDYVPMIDHTYEATYIPPTCIDGGGSLCTCTYCGESYWEYILDPLGHSYVYEVTEPTCTEPGYTIQTCVNCGMWDYCDWVEELGHEFDEWITTQEATCLEPGSEYHACKNCAYTETRPVDAKGHSYTDAVTQPTCKGQGYTTHTCTVCSYEYTDTYVDALGHSFGEWVTLTEPTEKTEGYEKRTCLVCGATEERTIPALQAGEYAAGTIVFCTDGIAYLYGEGGVVEETYTGWMTERYPYDADTGSIVYTTPWADSMHKITAVIIEDGVSPAYTDYWFMYCKNLVSVTIGDGVTSIDSSTFFGCFGLTEITIPGSVAVIGPDAFHDAFNLDKIIFEGDAPSIAEYALCNVSATAYYPSGNGTWTDAVMQMYMGPIVWVAYDGELPPVCEDGHTFEGVVIAPTCTQNGYTKYVCVSCGGAYVNAETNAVGHNYTSEVTQPTCTEKGYTTHCCENCGATYISDETEPTGHTWDTGVVTREPTADAEGEMTYTCTACGCTKTEAIEKIGDVIYDIPEDNTVTIPENDCFEDGTVVTVEKIAEGEAFEAVTAVMENVADQYVAYEFNATKDDVQVQPDGTLTMTFAIPEGYSDDVAVYYIAEDGTLTELTTEVDTDAGTVTVELTCCCTCIVADRNSAPASLPGDVNGDGKVNARDARALLRFIAGLAEESEIDKNAADFNGDGKINARDARAILRFIAGLD